MIIDEKLFTASSLTLYKEEEEEEEINKCICCGEEGIFIEIKVKNEPKNLCNKCYIKMFKVGTLIYVISPLSKNKFSPLIST